MRRGRVTGWITGWDRMDGLASLSVSMASFGNVSSEPGGGGMRIEVLEPRTRCEVGRVATFFQDLKG